MFDKISFSFSLALIGFVATFGYYFYYEGLKRLKASQTGMAELSTPFFTAILAFIFIKETITPLQFIGALILVLGIYLLSRKKD